MDYDALLSNLAQRLALPDTAFQRQQASRLVFDDVPVLLEPLPGGGGLFVSAELMTLPASEREEVLKRALRHNLTERGNTPAFLALHGSSDLLLLCQRFEAGTDYPSFERGLEALLNCAARVRQLLHSQKTEPSAGLPSEDWSPGFIRI